MDRLILRRIHRKGGKWFQKGEPCAMIPPDAYNKYIRVCIRVEGKVKRISEHRLMALKYIPNPNNLPHVGHKNDVHTDNRKCNLEWTTPKKNQETLTTTKGRVRKVDWGVLYPVLHRCVKEGLSNREICVILFDKPIPSKVEHIRQLKTGYRKGYLKYVESLK